jgi:putative DNA primase/helicase
LVGPKRSGKGTIGRVLTRLIGKHNCVAPTLAGLGTNFGLAPLIGKRLAIISDARLSGRADQHAIAERLLSITGEDALTIDRKYGSAWTGQLGSRFMILSNELPRLTGVSGALAGRFIMLSLTESFYGREDPGLTDNLLTALPGILNWAIAG